ncbi:putative F-box protein At3g23260 [Bidens hawaiensis]|uniref:putative F-box protein At3g23260 n=1 Tax=Bidens hawaiensis TaxID=980011 RepID=UPI004049C0B9
MPPQLPTHIILWEVLSRLPARYTCRFRRVCKAWNSFLSTPSFARMHLRYQTNYKLLLLDRNAPTFSTHDCDYSITTRPIPFKEPVLILATLDGLVCVALEKTRELAFWNPLTGAYKKFKTSFFDDICDTTALAFYIDSSNDYKLVHIVPDGAFIYSRRLDSWRKIKTSLEISYHESSIRWSLATFLGKKVYYKLLGMTSLISFDVESEKFKEIQLPPHDCNDTYVNLVALNGCIHYCVYYQDVAESMDTMCDIWRMDGDGWIKAVAFPRPCYRVPMLRQIYIKRYGDLLAIWKDTDYFEIIDLEDFATDYHIYRPFRRWYREHVGAVYVETLVSPIPKSNINVSFHFVISFFKNLIITITINLFMLL